MKLLKIKAMLGFLLIYAGINAASIDYLSNNSANFFQNPAQTGQISVEGVFYNPAGTVFLEDGQYLNLNLQNSMVQESMTLNGDKLASNKYAGAPSLNYLYKKNDYSLFVNASVIGGGATLSYDEGVPGVILAVESFNDLAAKVTGGYPLLEGEVTYNKFDGKNRYYQLMLGGAKKVNDKLSIGGGLKYVYADRVLNGRAEVSYNPGVAGSLNLTGDSLYINSKRTASGVGAVLSLDYKATDTLNFALKYETPVKLNFKSKATSGSNLVLNGTTIGLEHFYPKYADGLKSRRDLPGVLSLGASKQFGDWTVSAGYIHYFNKAANIDGYDYYNDGHEVNFGVDYKLNEKWTLHAGYNFAKTGAKKSSYNDIEYAIDSRMYMGGVTYKFNENQEIKFGIGHVSYKADNGENENVSLGSRNITLNKSKVKYDKSINVFTIGYTHKF